MNEESDGMNENENNSEVVILPERSHMEELLLSDPSQLREEQNAYERKLDEKLRDLGLYEDDMTINQKEELLAVVVISCETAEQEENKRQLIREYLEGAQSLEEEIEFSYQESAWLAGEANLLCSTVTQMKNEESSSNTKILSTFMDGEASTSEIKNFDSLTLAETSLSRNSPDIFEDETAYTDNVGDAYLSTSESTQKRSLSTKSHKHLKRDASSAGADLKIAVAHPIIQEQDDDRIETTEILDRQLSFQREKLLLDKSMNCWRPCSSPKDKPLSNLRLKHKKEENVSAAALQEKFNKYLTSFDKMASLLKPKRCHAPKIVQLSKPHVLMHQGSVAKKVTKLDNYDYIIGVSEKNQNNEDNEDNFLPCDETLTRTKSAFHRVKPLAPGKLLSFPDQNSSSESSVKVTRSGATYGSKRFKSDYERRESSPEIIHDSYNQIPSTSKDNFALEKHVTFHEDMTDTNKLPNFSDLRPDVNKCRMIVPSPMIQKDNVISNSTVKSNCDINPSRSAKKAKKEETIVRPVNDFSSDSSSPLIDVETVVDDEIEQFVLKRKLAPSSHKSLNAKNTSKRLKRSES